MTLNHREPEGDYARELDAAIDRAVAPYEKMLDEAAARERAMEADLAAALAAAVAQAAALREEMAVHQQVHDEHAAKLLKRIAFLEDDAATLRDGAAEAIRALRAADADEEET